MFNHLHRAGKILGNLKNVVLDGKMLTKLKARHPLWKVTQLLSTTPPIKKAALPDSPDSPDPGLQGLQGLQG